ncbi:MAG: polyphenol oxidase family protein, partial [Actinobacteria bacterium]|nr:polyphenol oxidase family protein [Actinomycetota bacterium]
VFADGVPSPVDADAHATDQPGLAPLVITADCLPVALAGPGGVAVAHAGWRGLTSGVLARAAEAVDAAAAAVGPGIGPCCYEVGEEVLDAFAGLDGVADDRMLDLPAAATALLAEAGVVEVELSGLCTSCNPELFYSHRRDGARTGRQAGVAWLQGPPRRTGAGA